MIEKTNPFLNEALQKSRKLTYDDKFKNNPFLLEAFAKSQNRYKHTPIEFTGSTGIGESIYDKNIPYSQLDNLEEIRAQRQPWSAKAGAGVGRVGAKVVSEILKMPGVAAGIVGGGLGQIADGVTGEDNTDFMQVAFNNPWVKAITELEESVKENVLPVYVKKAVSEGNLWDNISSIDFWATEGADGLGYIISMLAPGAAINRFKLGNRLVNSFGKYGKITDATVDAAAAMGRGGLPTTARNIDLWSQTIANTVFEAGAEAKSAMDGYESHLENLLSTGEIDQEGYDKLLKENQSRIGANVFGANAAILLGPNAIMAKMFWGKARNKAIQKSVNKETAQVEKVVKPGVLASAKLYGDDFGKAALREGFWEEGMQSTAENFFTENPEKGLTDFMGEFALSYMDNLDTVEGQKAILLGAAFGGGMQAYTGRNQRKAEREKTNNLIEGRNDMLSDMYNIFDQDIYLRDKDNKIKYDPITNNPIESEAKKHLKLKALNGLEGISALYDTAVKLGNTDMIEQLQDLLFTRSAMQFIVDDDLGIDLFQKHLESSSKLEGFSKEQNKDHRAVITAIVEKARSLQKEYNKFTEFAPDLIKLEDENATPQQKEEFYNKLASDYVLNKSRTLFLQKKLKEKEAMFQELAEESDLDIVDNKHVFTEDSNADSRLLKVQEEIRLIESSIEQNKKDAQEVWNSDKASEVFKRKVKEDNELQEEVETKSEEVTKTLKEIEEATTEEEVEEVKSKPSKADKVINEAKKAAKKKIKKIKEEKNKKREEENEEFARQEEARKVETEKQEEKDKEDYKVGDEIIIPSKESILFPLHGKKATITKISDKSITVFTEDGVTLQIFNEILEEDFSEANNYGTEGSVTNDPQSAILDVESGKVFERRNQPRIMITDNKKGEKLFFIDDAALEYERNPVDKVGEEKGIEVNPGKVKVTNGEVSYDLSIFTPNQMKAIQLFKAKDFSDEEFLVKHLPLNVKLTGNVVAPLETYNDNVPETSEDLKNPNYNDTFFKTTGKAREVIIKELKEGSSINDITMPIAGQWNGSLQLSKDSEGKPSENNLKDLYEFGGDIANIKGEDFYYVNDVNTLVNFNDEVFPASRPLSKGEIYLKIHTARGEVFPLKLNIQRISEEHANVLYELYKFRFTDIKGGKQTLLSQTSDALKQIVKSNFKKELKLLAENGKPFKDATIKDIVDLLIFDGSNNKKTRVRFGKNKKLLVGVNEFDETNFNTEFGKSVFIETLTSTKRGEGKRRQISVKRRKNDGLTSLNLENRSYLEYVVSNGILNTNAVVNEPTFQGKTTMYLGNKEVKVKGKLSEFNTGQVKEAIATPKAAPVEVPKVTLAGLMADGTFDNNGVVEKDEVILNPSQIDKSTKKEGKSLVVSEKSRILDKTAPDFKKMSEKEAQLVINNLIKNYNSKSQIRLINDTMRKNINKSLQSKAKVIFKALLNEKVSLEELKSKCGL